MISLRVLQIMSPCPKEKVMYPSQHTNYIISFIFSTWCSY